MSKGFPSMAALLGLIAVAGYQNRDKLAELIGANTGTTPNVAVGAGQQGGLRSVLGGLGGALGGTGTGGLLSNGLRELVERFQQNGKGDVTQSWVGTGPNKAIAPHELQAAIGPDVLSDLAQRTGLSQDELLARLSQKLPAAVDQLTPDGTLPS